MRPIPRRKLSELVMLYRLEPTSRDLFVEGTTDRAVFDFVLREARPFGTRVRWVDEIELDEPGITGVGGAKGRVKWLAEYAEANGITNIIAVLDRNTDKVTPVEGRTWLHPTIYPDLEFHLIADDEIGPLLTRATGLVPPAEAIACAILTAKTIYGVRLACREEELDPAFVAVSRSLETVTGRLCFNLGNFLTRMDSKNESGLMYRKLLDSVNGIVSDGMDGEDFMFVEFHCFEECLEAALRSSRYVPDGLFGKDWLGRLIRAAMTLHVAADPFFVGVLARVNKI